MLGSALLLAIQNVVLKVLFAKSAVFGVVQLGGYVTPTLGHSLLLLEMRTFLTLIGLSVLAPRLYPPVFTDLKSLVLPSRRPLLLKALVSGALLSIALTLLFVAISQLSSGIAVTIFFIYPPISAVLAWWVFGERLSAIAVAATVGVCLGVGLSAPSWSSFAQMASVWGALAALGAGFAYAWQGIFSQMCLKRIHPVPFSLLLFWTMFAICGVGLGLVTIDIPDRAWLPLWIGSGITATVTMGGYLLNNFGIRAIGVTPAFLVSASTPILTVLIAWLAISEIMVARQVFGVFLVVAGIFVVGLERLQRD
ncbi:MAG: DMT family transporter [Cyanobacteria bacterium P01_E01_bin.34]